MVRRDLSCAFLAAGKVSLAGAADVRPWVVTARLRWRCSAVGGWGAKMGTDGPDDELYGGLLRSGRADATVVRMLLGYQLRRLREAAGITPDQAAEQIRASRAKISRMENGRVGFKARDVADLLTLYGVTSEQARAAMLQLAQRASNPGWWADRKSTRLNSSHRALSRMPSSA